VVPLRRLIEAVHSGSLRRCIELGEHTGTVPVAEIVEAHRYVDNGHKRGNVVISLP
jgi:hypothetical protein